MINNQNLHKSVLLNEVLESLAPKDGEIYLDATFGAGGYSNAILQKANCKLYAIDRDALALKLSQDFSKKFPDRFKFLPGEFSKCKELLEEQGVSEIDGMVLDIGVSSMQLDDLSRGFSFDSDARLDMRMDENLKVSAYEVVNEFDESLLATIIREYGEEKKAKKIARKIIAARKKAPVTSCRDLADIVRSIYFGYFKIDPATRTFQAIRIFVNKELEELKKALRASVSLLKKGGRLVVVSFHSLEDKIVKDFLREESGAKKTYSRYQPVENNIEENVNFYLTKNSAILPSKDEINANPRSRSARLRFAYKKI